MIKVSIPIPLAGLLVSAAILATGTAVAEEYFVSYRYDGDYVGAAKITPELSNPSCTDLPLVYIEIRNGILRAYDDNNRQNVKGIVTGDGFFTSDYIFADGGTTLFEGLVDRRGQFTGGIIDGACAWVVKMSKMQSS